MLKLEFGIPSQRSSKSEKYPDKAVLTMLAFKGKGCSKKFEFNAKAQELINLNGEKDGVCMSFANEIFVVKSQGIEPEVYGLTKNSPKSFSNSKVYSYLTKLLKLDETIDNEFEVVAHESEMYGDAPVCMIRLMGQKTEVAETEKQEEPIALLDENFQPQVEETSDALPFDVQ